MKLLFGFKFFLFGWFCWVFLGVFCFFFSNSVELKQVVWMGGRNCWFAFLSGCQDGDGLNRYEITQFYRSMSEYIRERHVVLLVPHLLSETAK